MDISKRLISIDVLRGFDMLFILGLASLIVSLCNLYPCDFTHAIAAQMHHVSWDGLRHHDTIFPLFLFIAGLSFPFSYASQIAKGKSRKDIYIKIFSRAFLLFFINLIYNGLLNFDFHNLRYTGVLTRIGFAWMFAALIYINFKKCKQIIIAVVILIGYYLVMRFIPAGDMPAGTNPFSMEGNLAGYIDRLCIPGHFYQDFFDPEGILSTFPAIVTALLGMFTGDFVRKENISGERKTLYMFAGSIFLLIVGLLFSMLFPINKSLWTSSFVLVVAAYSLAMFALFYWIIDVKKWRKWSFIFRLVGLNSITIYLTQRFVRLTYTNHFFFGGFASLFPANISACILDLGYLSIVVLIAYFLYKQKIFLRV